MESSRRDLFIDIVDDTFIFKNNQITLSLVSPLHLNQVLDFLKQEIFFTVR